MVIKLTGWRYSVFIGGFVGLIGATLYPIFFQPLLNTDSYKKAQRENRLGVNQEEIQPGNMKIWTDPFDRKKT